MFKYYDSILLLINFMKKIMYENLKENIKKIISEIPKEKYENIFKSYERPENICSKE